MHDVVTSVFVGSTTRRSHDGREPPPPKKVQVKAAPMEWPAAVSRNIPRTAYRHGVPFFDTAYRCFCVRGSKRKLKDVVWELRVDLGTDPITRKR